MEFFAELEGVRERWDVLRHPFYVRWSAGELTSTELASYAGQYRHAVIALAEASSSASCAAHDEATRTLLEAYAAEEAEHVGLWDQFVAAIGGDVVARATPETDACVRAWSASGEQRSLLASLATMYAIESAQPAIARVKLEGLVPPRTTNRLHGQT